MKKILITGNSHIGALRSGLGQFFAINPHCANNYNFVFAGTKGAFDLVIENGNLTVSELSERYHEFLVTTEGKKTLKLNQFSLIFLVGGRSPLDIRQYLNKNPQPVSRAVIASIVKTIMSHTFERDPFRAHEHVFGKIVDSYSGKCFWIPNPCEPERLNFQYRDDPKSVFNDFRNVRGTKNAGFYLPLLESNCQQDADTLLSISRIIKEKAIEISLSYGVSGIIFPPGETLKNPFATRNEYSVGSRHFANGNKQPDIDTHMNSSYGCAVWTLIYETLKSNLLVS